MFFYKYSEIIAYLFVVTKADLLLALLTNFEAVGEKEKRKKSEWKEKKFKQTKFNEKTRSIWGRKPILNTQQHQHVGRRDKNCRILHDYG